MPFIEFFHFLRNTKKRDFFLFLICCTRFLQGLIGLSRQAVILRLDVQTELICRQAGSLAELRQTASPSGCTVSVPGCFFRCRLHLLRSQTKRQTVLAAFRNNLHAVQTKLATAFAAHIHFLQVSNGNARCVPRCPELSLNRKRSQSNLFELTAIC